MRDIDRALDDISCIRNQLAAGTLFRGLGPTVIAVTGGLAALTACAQSFWPEILISGNFVFFGCWIGAAAISAFLIGAEMLARSRRHHGGLADAMIRNAVGQFLPAAIAGAALAAVVLKFAPDQSWMLPGLWQMLVALGLFASARSLPSSIALVAAWYFVAGVGVLIVASGAQEPTPWMMGLPFSVGQFVMAGVLYFASGDEP